MRAAIVVVVLALCGCAGQEMSPVARTGPAASSQDPADVVALYGPITSEPHPIAALDMGLIDPSLHRQEVDYQTAETPGTIVVDRPTTFFISSKRTAGPGATASPSAGKDRAGRAPRSSRRSRNGQIGTRRPKCSIDDPISRRCLPRCAAALGSRAASKIRSARGLYLWQGNKDTLYRIHGTTEPYSIGKSVSSGCIRMINQDVIDLYARTPVGTIVKVLPDDKAAERK